MISKQISVDEIIRNLPRFLIGKLPLPQPPETYLPEQRKKHKIANLNLDEASVSHLTNLPQNHRDPFDRILICQALEHDLIIVTIDEQISQYPVQISGQV